MIAFITAIFGSYEATCKRFAKQTIDCDFICFTDNKGIKSNGWQVETIPYHKENPSPLDDGSKVNSMSNNSHPFNVAKYYKQAFLNIPVLRQYRYVVWLDGTIEVTDPRAAEKILARMNGSGVVGWNHEHRSGKLEREAQASMKPGFVRYNSTFWNNHRQPKQDVILQYNDYLAQGYDDSGEFWKNIDASNPHLGVWITCFVAFDTESPEVREFLDMWYLQTLTHTTQDQVGFSFVVQKTGLVPYTLPDTEIKGDKPHSRTELYIKHSHGK